MGLTEAVSQNSDDDAASDESPIEMTLVNRKKEGKKSKGKQRSQSFSEDSQEGSNDNLQLYDQDDEEGGVKADNQTVTEYNPFD